MQDYCTQVQEEQNMESQQPVGVTGMGYQTQRHWLISMNTVGRAGNFLKS